MATGGLRDPTCPDDWIAIANRELSNLRGAYVAKLTNDARVDHALRAIEAVLKAILWKQHGWADWPESRGHFKFLYRHDLEAMLTQCKDDLRLSLRLSPDHWASWRTVANLNLKHSRYSVSPPSDAETNAIVKSTRHPDVGVVPWLLKRFHEIA